MLEKMGGDRRRDCEGSARRQVGEGINVSGKLAIMDSKGHITVIAEWQNGGVGPIPAVGAVLPGGDAWLRSGAGHRRDRVSAMA